jgi:YggT family protein
VSDTAGTVLAASLALQTVLAWLLNIYVLVLVARALISWFPITPGTPVASLALVLERLTEPVLRPIRRLVPPIRAGGAALDLSIIIAVFGIYLVGRIVISFL